MKAKAAYRLLLAISACLAAAGCRTAGNPAATRPPAPSIEPRTSFKIDEYVRDHNRNARLIRNVSAKPSITATLKPPDGSKEQSVPLDGRLWMVQPYDFKLVASHMGAGNVANIGSNEDGFWFWYKNEDDKKIYRCAYQDLTTSNLTATFQPDWIVTAMGLKPISGDEATSAKILPGEQPGTTILRFPPSRDPASAYVREMVVNESTRRMTELRVFDRDGKTLIGRARIKSYIPVPLKADPEAGPDAPASPATCQLPNEFDLEWIREGLKLEIKTYVSRMSPPAVNGTFSDTILAGFVPPEVKGYQTEDLAQLARDPAPSRGGDTTVRETIPAPEPRRRTSTPSGSGGGVTLGRPYSDAETRLQSDDESEPVPRGVRPSSRRNAPRRVSPAATNPFMLHVGDDVVGPAPPRPAGTQAQTAAAVFQHMPLER